MPRTPFTSLSFPWLPVLMAIGLPAAIAAPGDIYQRTTADGILEITNVPSGEGYTLLLVVPQRTAPAPSVAPRPAPLAAVTFVNPNAAVADSPMDPDQILDSDPPAAGPPAGAPAAALPAVPPPVANVTPSAPNTPSAAAFAARLARYRDSTSRSTDLVMR